MKFIAEIDVMPLKALLDPQGKAVSASMSNVGLSEITNVRIGKHITLEVEADNEIDAKNTKLILLANSFYATKLWKATHLP